MNTTLSKALETVMLEAESSALGDNNEAVLAACKIVRNFYEGDKPTTRLWSKPKGAQFKPWDYVHHVKNKNEDDPRFHIFGTVIKQENDNVWLTDDNRTCEIIRVFSEDLELAESPEDNVHYEIMHPSSSTAEFEKEAVHCLSLYPHSSSDEQAILWRSFRRKAVEEGHKVYRKYIKTDHYYYFIPDLYVFCSENYA